MTAYISFLRGINVGGNKMIRMDALRPLYESLGFDDVRTLLQSGNVLFRTKKSDPATLSKKIEAAIDKTLGMSVTVMTRTADELEKVIEANPFKDRDFEPAKLAVMFLSAEPSAEAKKSFMEINAGPEEKHVKDRELYIYYPEGLGRSKLSNALIEKKLRVAATARNWNTVTKLMAMAEGE